MQKRYWMLEPFEGRNIKLGEAVQVIPFEQQRACARVIPDGWRLAAVPGENSFTLCRATNVAVQLPVLQYIESLLYKAQQNPSEETEMTVALCRTVGDQMSPVGVLLGNLFGPGMCGTAAVCRDVTEIAQSVDSFLSSIGAMKTVPEYRSVGILSAIAPSLETDSSVSSKLLVMLSRTDVPSIQAPFTADALRMMVGRIQTADTFSPPYVDNTMLSVQHIAVLAYGLAMQLVKRITVPFYVAHGAGATSKNLEEAAAGVYAQTVPAWDAVLGSSVVGAQVQGVLQTLAASYGKSQNEDIDPATVSLYESQTVSDKVKSFRKYCVVAAAQLIGLRQLLAPVMSFYDHSPIAAMLRGLSLVDIKSPEDTKLPMLAYSDFDLVLNNKDALVSELTILSTIAGEEVTGESISTEMVESISEGVRDVVTPACSSREELFRLGAYGLLSAYSLNSTQKVPLLLSLAAALGDQIKTRRNFGREWALYMNRFPADFHSWLCQDSESLLSVLNTICLCGTASKFSKGDKDKQVQEDYHVELGRVASTVLPIVVRNGYLVTDAVEEMNALPRESA